MIPHQIYCDYLEDKGIDCRLFRIEENSVVIATNLGSMMDRWNVDDLATGRNFNYGFSWGHGDGEGYGNMSGSGVGLGCGSWNGDGHCNLGQYQ